MSEPWWMSGEKPPAGTGLTPRLALTKPRDLMRQLRNRRLNYTPEWVDPPDGDGGGALVELHAGQLSEFATRINRLPEKTRIEILAAAGVDAAPPQAASAVVAFTVSEAARGSVAIAAGFQVAASGRTGRVIFETQDNLFATPLSIQSVRIAENDTRLDVSVLKASDNAVAVEIFPANRLTTAALEIGLSGKGEIAAPGATLSLGFAMPPTSATRVIAGSVAGDLGPIRPTIQWEAFVAGQFAAAQIVVDGTAGLTQPGIVILRPPPSWTASQLPADDGGRVPAKRFWVRARVVEGKFTSPVALASVRVNVVAVRAIRTIRNETLIALDDDRRRFRLRNVPVIAGSVLLDIPRAAVSEVALSRLTEEEAERVARTPGTDRWQEVPTLAGAGPGDSYFTLDPLTGDIEFGDGVNGAAVPAGVVTLQALRYAVGGGAEGAVDAKSITQLVSAAPFVLGVTNPDPAVGGADAESIAAVIRDGPRRLRSLGRAVGENDYAALALSAPGVRRVLVRAHRDPARPQFVAPGVVGIWLVGKLAAKSPMTAAELNAVAAHLTRLAPMGVRIAAAPARFRLVTVDLRFQSDPAADQAATTAQIVGSLDSYFDPVTGGDDGAGWPFGGPIRHAAVVRRLFDTVPQVRNVTAIRFVVDGVPFANCRDVPIGPADLLQSGNHSVAPDVGGASKEAGA